MVECKDIVITSSDNLVRKVSFRIDRRVWKGALLLGILALALTAFSSRLWSEVAWIFFAMHFCFFREPGFKITLSKHPVSPAYGTISDIKVVQESRYLQESAIRIGISLSLFVPHVQMVPCSGVVEFQEYLPGTFKNALKPVEAQTNESNWVGFRAEGNKVMVRQMAGVLARKIYSDVSLNQRVIQGSKLGVICYGSRVECFLPEKNFKAWVKVGDVLRGGQTPLGEWIS